jgi:tRNA (mo5U34)-methyltransferase
MTKSENQKKGRLRPSLPPEAAPPVLGSPIVTEDKQPTVAIEPGYADEIITAAYKAVLGRPPDVTGLQAYKDMCAGISLSKQVEFVVNSLLNSREFEKKRGIASAERSAAQRPIQWFHSFDLGNGEAMTGIKSLETLRREADIVFREPVAGKTVLDIGAWDGYFSFDAERRGASDILATDHFSWSGPGWGSKAGFNYIHAKRNSRVRTLDIDVFDLDPRGLGTFDVCLFLGVLYHLKNPFGGLEKVFQMTDELAVIETVVTELRNPLPVLRFYKGKELDNDATNFFVPNQPCLEAMLREVGFKKVAFTPHRHPPTSTRGRTVVHAWK